MKAHDYPQIYKELEIDLSKLGCLMLDVKPLSNMWSIEVDGAGCALYYAKDKTRFWIDGWVAELEKMGKNEFCPACSKEGRVHKKCIMR